MYNNNTPLWNLSIYVDILVTYIFLEFHPVWSPLCSSDKDVEVPALQPVKGKINYFKTKCMKRQLTTAIQIWNI